MRLKSFMGILCCEPPHREFRHALWEAASFVLIYIALTVLEMSL
jgi:hypothetical protein